MSGETNQFYRESVPDDNKCLFWAFLFGIKPLLKDIFGDVPFDEDLKKVINEGLRELVLSYIRSNEELQELIPSSYVKFTNMKDYYSELEQGVLWGGQPELKALSHLYNIIICVINPDKIIKKNCLLPSYYGEDNRLASKCIYIYYNGTHYDPLYLVNNNNHNIKETIFDPNDRKLNVLLKKFIRDEFHHHGDIQLGLQTDIIRGEIPKHTTDSNETEIKRSSPPANTQIKRKESGVADTQISSNNDRQLPELVPKKYYNQHKRVKVSHDASDPIPPYNINIPEATSMNHLIVYDAASIQNSQADQEQTPDPSNILIGEQHEENNSDN